MRYLILSDLHANWEALQAVLKHADNDDAKYDRILCLGDVVGYGADPNAVTEWVRAHVEVTIRGNHDKAAAGLDDLEWFNPAARASALWTQETATQENLEWLANLPRGPMRVNGFDILHGSPVDEDEYLISNRDAAQVAPYVDVPLSFFGHTHLQGGFALRRGFIRRVDRPVGDAEDAALQIESDWTYLLNPGSVGQPRDGDPRAAYAVYDTEHSVVTYCRVPYDISAAQEKILAAGLPDSLARRLEVGG